MASFWRTAISSRIVGHSSPFGPGSSGLLAGLALCAAVGWSADAGAFSQITRPDGSILDRDDVISAPLPPLDPERGPPPSRPAGTDPATADDEVRQEPADGPGENPGEQAPSTDSVPAAPLPILYGEDGLPRPVRDLRARLIEIASSGEIDALRPYLETGAEPTALSVVPIDEDPIAFLKAASGDGEGVEILAILLDVLESGHVRLEPGADDEIFIWPYFAQVSIEDLTRPELVELFQIVTAGDYQQMLENGAYYFYRVGISPDGRLEFFLAGD